MSSLGQFVFIFLLLWPDAPASPAASHRRGRAGSSPPIPNTPGPVRSANIPSLRTCASAPPPVVSPAATQSNPVFPAAWFHTPDYVPPKGDYPLAGARAD